MTQPGLVVFDCDGVLVDTERLTVAVESRVLTELGWAISSAEVVERWMGTSSASQLADLEAHLGQERTRAFDERTTAELHTAFERELTAIEGVADLVDDLHRAGVPTCVASSGTHERIRRTLGITGLLAAFEGRIFSAADVEHGKPAPDLFLHAAALMRVDPAACAVVEDSVYGVRAGVAAWPSTASRAGLTPETQLRQAGAVTFATMADLARVLLPDAG